MSLSPKTRLGTYEIVGPLGAGGMGEVYRARDLRLGREVAVTSAGGGILTRPARPLRTRSAHGGGAQSSQHRHPLLRRGENGIRFLTMELVEGQTLSTLVSPGG